MERKSRNLERDLTLSGYPEELKQLAYRCRIVSGLFVVESICNKLWPRRKVFFFDFTLPRDHPEDSAL